MNIYFLLTLNVVQEHEVLDLHIFYFVNELYLTISLFGLYLLLFLKSSGLHVNIRGSLWFNSTFRLKTRFHTILL